MNSSNQPTQTPASPASQSTQTPAAPPPLLRQPAASPAPQPQRRKAGALKVVAIAAALGVVIVLLVSSFFIGLEGKKSSADSSAAAKAVATNTSVATDSDSSAPAAPPPAAPPPAGNTETKQQTNRGAGFTLRLVRYDTDEKPVVPHEGCAINQAVDGSTIETVVLPVEKLGPETQKNLKSGGYVVYFRVLNAKLPAGVPAGARYFFRREWAKDHVRLQETCIPTNTDGLKAAGYTVEAVQVPRQDGDFVSHPTIQWLDSVAWYKAAGKPTKEELDSLSVQRPTTSE